MPKNSKKQIDADERKVIRDSKIKEPGESSKN